jgi:hypothetical protein
MLARSAELCCSSVRRVPVVGEEFNIRRFLSRSRGRSWLVQCRSRARRSERVEPCQGRNATIASSTPPNIFSISHQHPNEHILPKTPSCLATHPRPSFTKSAIPPRASMLRRSSPSTSKAGRSWTSARSNRSIIPPRRHGARPLPAKLPRGRRAHVIEYIATMHVDHRLSLSGCSS